MRPAARRAGQLYAVSGQRSPYRPLAAYDLQQRQAEAIVATLQIDAAALSMSTCDAFYLSRRRVRSGAFIDVGIRGGAGGAFIGRSVAQIVGIGSIANSANVRMSLATLIDLLPYQSRDVETSLNRLEATVNRLTLCFRHDKTERIIEVLFRFDFLVLFSN